MNFSKTYRGRGVAAVAAAAAPPWTSLILACERSFEENGGFSKKIWRMTSEKRGETEDIVF
jgi:hypothetical protein